MKATTNNNRNTTSGPKFTSPFVSKNDTKKVIKTTPFNEVVQPHSFIKRYSIDSNGGGYNGL